MYKKIFSIILTVLVIGFSILTSKETTFAACAQGCTDPSASNYNPLACGDDGSCVYPTVAGCTNTLATNYNNEATEDDGSCIFVVSLINTTNDSEITSEFTNKGYIDDNGELSGSYNISLSNTNGLIPISLNLKNNKNKLKLPANLHFKQNNGITDYTAEVIPPTDYAVATVDGKNVISAISVGNETESIKLINDVATLSIPALSKSIGEPVSIYSSLNGIDWTLEKGGIVQEVDNQSYAVFSTNHFTYFAIADSTGSFVINDDNVFASGLIVNLTISAPTAQYMRFSNEGTGNRSSWESYAIGKVWTLFPENGLRTVYAEFDVDGDYIADASTLDTIELDGGEYGQLSLEITDGISECIYGTSLNLGDQNIKLDQGYTFTGAFSGQWYCADYVGVSSGWAFTIGVSDLTNEGGNIISGSNILVSHGGAVTEGDNACTGYDGTANVFNETPYTLIEKSEGSDKICKVTLSNVNIEVAVPAFQAPGSYVGTLTLTVPNF